MGREVTHDGRGALLVRFPFDRDLVDLIKTLPNRRWNATRRHWWIPDTDVVRLVDLLLEENFEFDGPTRDLYRQRGGVAPLDKLAAPGGPALPGLFDEAKRSRRGTETGYPESDDYSVSSLNERVKEILETEFPRAVWLVGEISGFNKNSHRRHVSFDLVEREAEGGTVSKVPATLFESDRRSIEQILRQADDPFRLEDEVTVRVQARVELYVPWGQYRVVVQGIDVRYTLGEAARRREEIIRRLTEAGLLGINAALPLTPVPLRVGLITSVGSDAYNDVLRSLTESGFAFWVTVHGARVQGSSTEPSVLNALDWFAQRFEEFDVILVCRGGGARTDLMWFDSEKLGRAVAVFPLPVVVGIGHEQDRSVLDAVGRSCKTPTAAARLLVDAVREWSVQNEGQMSGILDAAMNRIDAEALRMTERVHRLVMTAQSQLQHERTQLRHRRERTALGARGLVSRAQDRLQSWRLQIPREASLRIEKSRLALDGAVRALLQVARRRIDLARETIARQARMVGPGGGRRISREAERLEVRSRRLRLVDPQRVVERGYAIVRAEAGAVLTDPLMAPRGSRVQAELRRGTLQLISDGCLDENPGGN